ncbi:DUF2490 domain-containing protein [uncultured Draconibacterium sp.]|uniref:DUF2490 domain-containing protein n=1 Tax=uncultured Draconibacterium sp. TaxID=1573823 RepID=UPI0029C634F3|nr:DUF2490 domain-containing protein [uncultured Draconibacterium sp.]
MKTRLILTIVFVISILATQRTFAQETENEFQTRTKLDMSFKPVKKVKFTITPELRFEDDFSLDKYLLEGILEYKASKLFTLGASYGLVGNVRDEKDTEYFSRYAFSATAQKEFGRFESSLRLMYSNYADDDVDDKNFLRYRAKVKYDIPDCKITPFVAVQLFQDLDNGGLHKTRYSVGADYKLFKKNYIGIDYKFDYYNTEYLNKHIISLGYKIKF